jgi:ParB family chromosome partitioning protein
VVLKDAAAAYKVDTDEIAKKVKQEFASKAKAKTAKRAAPRAATTQQTKPVKEKAAA